ncbi:MAG TPA: LapA family protein [Gammaproteobacteria bacterium]|nr:LapA family protein [Gammaproteobacteria bacterium]
MLRLIGFLLLIVLVVLGVSFAVLNAEPVSLNYYFGYLEIPLSMVVVVSLTAGALIGALVSMGVILRLKRQLARTRRELRKAEKQAAELQVLPVGGD